MTNLDEKTLPTLSEVFNILDQDESNVLLEFNLLLVLNHLLFKLPLVPMARDLDLSTLIVVVLVILLTGVRRSMVTLLVSSQKGNSNLRRIISLLLLSLPIQWSTLSPLILHLSLLLLQISLQNNPNMPQLTLALNSILRASLHLHQKVPLPRLQRYHPLLKSLVRSFLFMLSLLSPCLLCFSLEMLLILLTLGSQTQGQLTTFLTKITFS